jgi:ABC-type multidrug transport system fused ATPase/permease subunit
LGWQNQPAARFLWRTVILQTYRKLLEMMTPRERARFWTLVAITFVLSAIEAGSVISILPFLHLISDPGVIETNSVYAWAYDTFGFESTEQFLIAAGIAVFVVTVVGLVMKMATIWATTRFALMRSYSFSSRLLSSYLHQPYEWFLSRHSATLGTSVLSEVEQVVNRSVLPAVQIVPQVFTISLLILALFVLEPMIAIGGALLVGVFYGLIYLGVRKLMSQMGEIQLAVNRERFHSVQEAMGGVKELKIIGLEAIYLSRFREAALRLAQIYTRAQILNMTPRYALEAIAFGSMILLILFLLVERGGNIATMVPTLGIIAAAGLRLIPALQLLYSQITTMRHGTATLNSVHHDMTALSSDEAQHRARRESIPARPLERRLELRDIRYAYPGTDRPALRGLDMTIEANTTIGIVGGTGAGKTTLVDIILGLLNPQEGEMLVDGTPVTHETRRAWQKTLGYVPQTIFLSDGTVAENIAFGLSPEKIDRDAVERAAQVAALHEFVMTELPRRYDTMVGERGVRLSGGQRQRVGIARALYHNPSMLIFDEATSALDTLTERAVMEAVDSLASQKTIVLIAHRLSTVRNCDRIFLLREGKVAASGRFEELVEIDDQFRRMAVGA